MSNGRIRYYGEIDQARKPGKMFGRRTVREWNPNNGNKRTWMDTIDQNGITRQVRPQLPGGLKTHYMFDYKGYYTGKW